MVDLEKLSYLAVDDDPNTRQILAILLKQVIGSSQVTILKNSEDFSIRLHSLPYIPSIIFLDIMVAPLNGFEMLEIIRSSPKYQSTIVIALTARVMTEDVARMKTAKFDGMIGKPIVRHVFSELIQRIISGDDIWYIA